MKIYTKKGDNGTTGLIGGTRLPKHHIRIESYGNVDELNSYLGLISDLIDDAQSVSTILEIQERLFTIGSHLANDPKKSTFKLPEFYESDISFLENEIDKMDAELEPMKFFVLPGGHETVSQLHIARCICRRAERAVVHLEKNEEVDVKILSYLNRLSDYLFVLSRKVAKDLNVNEIPWKPREK